MGIFNQHSINQPHQSFLRGLQGSPGIGFSLTRDGNDDMNNKKLKNVGEGVESSDAVTKHQLETAINSKINTSPSLNNYVKKDSPEVAADLDMKGFAIKHLKVTPGGDGSATSRKYVDRKLDTKANKNDLNDYLKLDGSKRMSGNFQMNRKRIVGLTNVPVYNGEATNKRYVDVKLNAKANKNDLNDYLKLDGSDQMQGDLNMNNKRILKLPDPELGDEPVTKKFLSLTNSLFYNEFLDLQGNSKMRGNIQMNDNRITELTNPPNADDEATNKKYVDTQISKSIIKPSHDSDNKFKYLMNDVNEWSTEYGVKVGNFSNFPESPHYWNITPEKRGSNYRFRLGLQMLRLKLVIELLNRDYETWQRQESFINLVGIRINTFGTRKYQYHYENGVTYYTKSLLTFTKTSSSPPVFVYYTVYFDDNAGDMNTYPNEYKNQVYLVASGVKGLTGHVDTEVYDAHEAFEIDKTKMKMLVPSDMNGKQLMNVNYDLKFGDIFKTVKYDTRYSSNRQYFIVVRKDNHQVLSFSSPVIVNSITFHNKKAFHNNASTRFITGGQSTDHEFKLGTLISSNLISNLTPWLELNSGFRLVRLKNLVNNFSVPFDIDFIISYT